jgi:hypothetical protein
MISLGALTLLQYTAYLNGSSWMKNLGQHLVLLLKKDTQAIIAVVTCRIGGQNETLHTLILLSLPRILS